MQHKNKILFVIMFDFLLVLALSACAVNTSQNNLPDLAFEQLQAQPIYVANYEVQPLPEEQKERIRQEKGFAVDPSKVVENYFMHRYRAAGNEGQLLVSINDISLEQAVEKSESSIGQFLNVDKQDKYTIQATIRLLARGIDGFDVRYVDIHARQMISMSEHISLAKREKMQAESVYDLVKQLDAEAQKILRNEFRISGGL